MVEFTFRKAGIQGAGSVFLSRMKKNIGMYIALTGDRLKGQ